MAILNVREQPLTILEAAIMAQFANGKKHDVPTLFPIIAGVNSFSGKGSQRLMDAFTTVIEHVLNDLCIKGRIYSDGQGWWVAL